MNSSAQRSGEAILAAVREVEQEAAGGAEALFMAAMLAKSPLPYDFALSVEGTPHNPSLINPAAAFFAATATMEPLITRGLVDVDVEQQEYILPDDVRAVILASLTDIEQREWAGRAIYGLNLILPDAEPNTWPTVEWLMPHIEAARDLIETLPVHTAAANRVLHQTGFALYHRQRHQEAADFLDRALAVDVALKGREHPDICADLEGLGTVLWEGGQAARAEVAFAGCLELQQHIFTEDNPVSAPILNSLAVVRHSLGKFEAADQTFAECRRILTLTQGENHPSVASCLVNHALLKEAMGQPAQALKLAEQALTINATTYGAEHSVVADDYNTVGLLKEALGDMDGAEAAFRSSLAIRRTALGDNHPDTPQALCNLALLLDRKGDEDESVSLYEKGLSMYEAILGAGHPLMEPALDNYIALLERTDRKPESDRLRAMTRNKLKAIVERAQ